MLFEGFNDLDFDKKIEFYQHEQNWHNRFILGDSLSVMNSLADKEALKNSFQMIYFDPPYGIKFGSNWQVSTRKREVSDTKTGDVTSQPEQVKAYRDTWKREIHSYLAYLRDRLIVAHELLSDSGSIFLQISDENVHLVRSLLDEVFGSKNFISTIAWTRGTMTSAGTISSLFDYLLWYSKDVKKMKFRQLYNKWDERSPDPLLKSYTRVEFPDGNQRRMKNKEKINPALLPNGCRRFADYAVISQTGGSARQPFEFEGRTYIPPGSSGWKASFDGLNRLAKQGRLLSTGTSLRYIRYADDFPGREITNMWTDTSGGRSEKEYVVETNPKVIQRCLLMTTDPGDLVLDPTCGSGTTAYVAEQWGRRWITVDTSKVALALARTRLMSAKYPYYRLEDVDDIKKGFSYKTAPYVSLSDMANNTEIDDIHVEYAEKLDPLRTEMNALAEQNWEEWEIPTETDSSWDPELQKLHRVWLSLKRERQLTMDASTAKRAKSETLYDQPYIDKKRVRVTGPFTVESLSPNIALEQSDAESHTSLSPESVQEYHQHIIEHLRTAGVQSGVKDQGINFDWIEAYPGEWVHAEGMWVDKEEKQHHIAISIGPQYDTVGKQWIRESAKEAVRKIAEYDLLIVAGITFEGYTANEVSRIGQLPILPVKISPELMVRELKNTGEGNLFMVFGEPDVEIAKNKDDTISVKLLGVDVYDPVKGLLRSGTPEDIACWFIDTAYNGEAFIVRHAYFTGKNEPYKQLQKALKAEINEEAWEALYRTESLPFAKPESGKIAVKVINHYGDEVMKEYKV